MAPNARKTQGESSKTTGAKATKSTKSVNSASRIRNSAAGCTCHYIRLVGKCGHLLWRREKTDCVLLNDWARQNGQTNIDLGNPKYNADSHCVVDGPNTRAADGVKENRRGASRSEYTCEDCPVDAVYHHRNESPLVGPGIARSASEFSENEADEAEEVAQQNCTCHFVEIRARCGHDPVWRRDTTLCPLLQGWLASAREQRCIYDPDLTDVEIGPPGSCFRTWDNSRDATGEEPNVLNGDLCIACFKDRPTKETRPQRPNENGSIASPSPEVVVGRSAMGQTPAGQLAPAPQVTPPSPQQPAFAVRPQEPLVKEQPAEEFVIDLTTTPAQTPDTTPDRELPPVTPAPPLRQEGPEPDAPAANVQDQPANADPVAITGSPHTPAAQTAAPPPATPGAPLKRKAPEPDAAQQPAQPDAQIIREGHEPKRLKRFSLKKLLNRGAADRPAVERWMAVDYHPSLAEAWINPDDFVAFFTELPKTVEAPPAYAQELARLKREQAAADAKLKAYEEVTVARRELLQKQEAARTAELEKNQREAAEKQAEQAAELAKVQREAAEEEAKLQAREQIAAARRKLLEKRERLKKLQDDDIEVQRKLVNLGAPRGPGF